jgi:ABC-type glycerol-3-phosphate transport system substrate-binding protein
LGVSGRLASITSSARHTKAASDVLLWLAGKDKGAIIASQSPACTLYRSSQLPAANVWIDPAFGAALAGEYAQAFEAAQNQPLWMFSPRLPGREEYLAALDDAVGQALRGEQSPEQALAAAAEKWREITKRLGLEAQKQAYIRSLGLER